VSGLVAAEEGARGQLAAELHDTVAQSLMIAAGLLASGPADARAAVAASRLRLRRRGAGPGAHGAHPAAALREGDLASASTGLRADMSARYGLTVHVEWPAQAHPLPLASAITVYRFFQEAL
jgi:signal transduction histidine kinase